jgi:sterol 3beta-glucosyltransferase
MVITILTTGSRGDTQPYIALGIALKKAGHHVRIAAFENYEFLVASYGLEYLPIKGDVSKIISGDIGRDASKADNPLKILMSFNKLQTYVFDLQKDFYSACQGSDAIVYHPGAPIGYFAAHHLNIPSILATPFPMTPTMEYPSLIIYDSIRLGRVFNLLTHKLFEKIMWFTSSSPIKQFWKKEFGKTPKDFGCPFGKQNTKTLPTLISCSNFVFPRPKDWPENVTSTGYWFLDEEMGWKPPNDLLEFLHKGKPPIYIGFGSMGDATLADQTTELVIKALRRSGQRGILATGWNGMLRMERVPEEIFILENAPHSWLFPQVAAVVHHGGAGTTAAGLRAGVPSIIIPYSNDQFAWGRRVFELGVGSKPIPRKKLTAETLSDAINLVLTGEIIDASRELGRKIQSENGAEVAAKIINSCFEQKGS